MIIIVTICLTGLMLYPRFDKNENHENQRSNLETYPELIFDSLNKKIFVYDSFFVFIDSTQYQYSETYLQLNSLDHTIWSLSSNHFEFTPYYPGDLLLEKIWEPKKIPKLISLQ